MRRMNIDIREMVDGIKEKVGEGKALCAFSGGVDSSVSALLAHKAIGRNLHCIYVDTGLMRRNESEQVEIIYKRNFGMNLIKVEAEERFLTKLAGVSDPERKRIIIGEEFVRVFEEEAGRIGDVDCFIQGTIYPDVAESGTEGGNLVKSHHNVGGLPEKMKFKKIIEPLRELYKSEVRKIAIEMGIPEEMAYRQPFPGPGLAVRCLGEVTKEKLEILRAADHIYLDEIFAAGLGRVIWQCFAVLTDLRSTGVIDGKRTYGYTIALRAVNSERTVTATCVEIPFAILKKISKRITDEIKEVNRVVYDVTDKPPGTIEWE